VRTLKKSNWVTERSSLQIQQFQHFAQLKIKQTSSSCQKNTKKRQNIKKTQKTSKKIQKTSKTSKKFIRLENTKKLQKKIKKNLKKHSKKRISPLFSSFSPLFSLFSAK
jgi:hypothetical protein